MNANSSGLVSIRGLVILARGRRRFFRSADRHAADPKTGAASAKSAYFRRFGNRHFCDFSFNTACCERLLQLKDSAAYNLTVDLDVDAIGTGSECTRAQIVYVLTTINSEV